jgi:hypothetical protein
MVKEDKQMSKQFRVKVLNEDGNNMMTTYYLNMKNCYEAYVMGLDEFCRIQSYTNPMLHRKKITLEATEIIPPEKKKRDLCKDDFIGLDWGKIRFKDTGFSVRGLIEYNDKCVILSNNVHYTYDFLRKNFEWSKDGGEDWGPCEVSE